MPQPTGAPDFKSLRDAFLSRAGIDDLRSEFEFDLDELSPEQVFDALDDGQEKTRQAIRREIWWACEPKEPNANHYAVAAMLAAGVKVWTPNFDTMIETAARRQGFEIDAIAPGASLEATAPALYKPHGTFPFPGDPPQEPPRHDYDLLFQASRVWLLDEDWAEKLAADVRGQDLFLFGYRGADPDLTPVLLESFKDARSVTWWEFPGDAFTRLQQLLGDTKVKLEAGNPSQGLLALGQTLAPHPTPTPSKREPPRPMAPLDFKPSNVSLAQLLGQLRGPGVARSYLAKALFFDRGIRKLPLFLKLLRSAGYDIRWVRAPLMAALGALLRLPGMHERPVLTELYATLLDSRPIRRSDRRAIERLRAGPSADRPQILTRIASIEKLHGEFMQAAADAECSLSALRHERRPALEAMTIYILAWTYRQRGEFGRRAAVVERYEDRMPHIGFNWAAWLQLDQALVSLHAGMTDGARKRVDSPFMEYARRLIRHPMFQLDDDLTRVLVRWHEDGPDEIDLLLGEILERHPIPRFTRPAFTAIDTMIVLGDHARASRATDTMRRCLDKARSRTCSDLQLAEIELIEVVASEDRARLERLRMQVEKREFGLISRTVDAVISSLEERPQDDGAVIYRPELPLAGCY
ncbi:MAG TPA: SIR2 family protein [Solirubrobacterales bacterium]